MKTFAPVLLIISMLLLLSSCSTLINMQKSYPPQIEVAGDTNNLVFVNYFDYTVPEYIKDRQEITYKAGVKGFCDGLSSGFAGDSYVNFIIGDTLSRRNRVNSMQDPSFKDSVRAVCTRFNANLMIALDSINIWFDWETFVEDNTDGSRSKTKNFYLYSSNYITLYSSDGEVIDRSTTEESMLYRSRPTLSGLITIKPSLVKAKDDATILSDMAGRDYAAKFYPSSAMVPVKIYTGQLFTETNKYIMGGTPVLAIEPLRELSASPDPKIAKKAAHNLSVVYEIMENRRISDQVFNGPKNN